MREIKFRAWDVEEKVMIPGDALAFEEYAPLCDLLKDTSGMKFMQFTGFLDKNGKEIYEGDISKNNLEETIISIQWDNTGAGWEFNEHNIAFDDGVGGGDWRFTLGVAKICEVIGNIYENPELLTC